MNSRTLLQQQKGRVQSQHLLFLTASRLSDRLLETICTVPLCQHRQRLWQPLYMAIKRTERVDSQHIAVLHEQCVIRAITDSSVDRLCGLLPQLAFVCAQNDLATRL